MEIVTPVFPGVASFGKAKSVFDIFFPEQFQKVFIPFPQEVSLTDTDPEKLELFVGGVKKWTVGFFIIFLIELTNSIIVKLSDGIVKIEEGKKNC